MARQVVCSVTHERGTNDTFYQMNGKYYKSQEVYEAHNREVQLRFKIIDHICLELMGYEKGQRFPSLITKRLKELSFYPLEVVWDTLISESEDIQYYMDMKCFDNDVGKVSYIFAALDCHINDYYRKWQEEQAAKVPKPISPEAAIDDAIDTKNVAPAKNISQWLGDDSE